MWKNIKGGEKKSLLLTKISTILWREIKICGYSTRQKNNEMAE